MSAYPHRMGVERFTAEFLAWCRTQGVDFRDALTLGRQDFDVVSRDLSALGIPTHLDQSRTAEPFFAELGATTTASIDASPFEGATITHDLARPLPAELVGRFTVVFDGGTLEHIFDFPRALENALSAVTPGGHFITVGPTNNDAGHGMYQFSPELWFRALGQSSGFRVRRVLLREMRGLCTQWWDVRDPADVGSRPMFTSAHPAQLYVLAERVDASSVAVEVAQSDYAAAWATGSAPVFANGRSQIADLLRGPFVGRWLGRAGLRPRPAWFNRPRYRSLRRHFTPAGRHLLGA